MARRIQQIKKIVHKDGTTKWRFRADMGRNANGKRIQQWRTFDSYKLAEDEWNRIQAKKADGVLVIPSKLTVDAYLTQWMDGKRNLKAGTRRTYADNLKPVREKCGQLELVKLTKTHLDKMVTWMLTEGRRVGNVKRKGVSAATVCRTLTVLSGALDSAVKEGLLVRNVAKLVEKPTHTPAETITWTVEQAQKFLAHVNEDRLYGAWLLTMCGLRRGEVCGLKWNLIDFNGDKAEELGFPKGTPTLTVFTTRVSVAGEVIEEDPKSKKSKRHLPLDKSMLNALKKMKAKQAEEKLAAGPAYVGSGLIVVNELGEEPRPEWYGDKFQWFAKKAGLPVIRLHDARHTCGTLMHLRGTPPAVISAWLGHASSSFTMDRYVHSQNPALITAGGDHMQALTGT